MKYFLSSVVFILTCTLSFTSLSQHGQLQLTTYNNNFYEDSTCFQVTVYNQYDTAYSHTMDDPDDLEWLQLTIDSLEPGTFFVNMKNCGVPTDELVQSTTKVVEIRDAEMAKISFDLSQHVRYSELDTDTGDDVVHGRNEIQLELSYFDFRWNPDGNNPKFNLGIASSGYTWIPFSKHVGFLMGGGVGFTFAPLQIDEENSANYPNEIKSNYYSYVYAMYDVKLRFSTLNQQSPSIKAHTVMFDIGAVYNFPLYFKHVTRFDIQDKLVSSFIHRYSDVRLYANLGITNFQFFVSYRPFDFVAKDFPEFPKYNAGVKWNLNFN